MASLRQQYGLRVQSDEFRDMRWDEFSDLVGGLTDQTPLVRVAQMRTTTDRDLIQQMTPEQRRERADWQRRRAFARRRKENDAALAMMQQAFARAFGGGDHG